MSVSVHQSRLDLESRERPLSDKRLGARQAIELVHDGDTVAVGGTLYSRTPMALVFALLRAQRRALTLARSLTCYEADLLLATGSVERIVTSWVGIGLPWGLSPVLRHYVEGGLADYEEWSHLAFGLRLKAAAMGVPFLPTMTMLGSDLAKRVNAATISCPYTGQELLAVPALVPDVTMLHVHRADMYGNAQIDGYVHMDVDMARAARTVILSAEEIISPEQIAAAPERTVLPHFVVDAVVEAPFGAYPHECYGRYEADTAHFDGYVGLLRQYGPVEGAQRYMAANLDAYDDFAGFVAAASGRLDELAELARGLTP